MLRRLTMGVALVGALSLPMVSFAMPGGTLLAQAGISRVILDDGSVVEGEITSMTADEIVVKNGQGTRTIPRARVTRIEFGPPAAATPAPPATPAPGATPAMTPSAATPPPPQPTPAPEGWTKPGTEPAPTPTPDMKGAAPGALPRRPDAFRTPHPAFVFNGFLGGKTLNEDWDPVTNQVQFGMEMTFLPMSDIPLGFAIDGLFAGGTTEGETTSAALDDNITYSANTAEFDVGVRFLQEIDPHLPIALSLGGGVALVSASKTARNELTDEEIYDDGDGGQGLWASAGVHVRLVEFLNVGAGMRWMSARNVVLLGDEIDPGGFSFGVTAGFSFGFPEQYRRTRRVYVGGPPAAVVTPPPAGVREMWINTPWGGSQYVAVGQWVVVERSDGPPISGRVNRLFPDAVEVDSNQGLVYIPTNRIMRVSAAAR